MKRLNAVHFERISEFKFQRGILAEFLRLASLNAIALLSSLPEVLRMGLLRDGGRGPALSTQPLRDQIQPLRIDEKVDLADPAGRAHLHARSTHGKLHVIDESLQPEEKA